MFKVDSIKSKLYNLLCPSPRPSSCLASYLLFLSPSLSSSFDCDGPSCRSVLHARVQAWQGKHALHAMCKHASMHNWHAHAGRHPGTTCKHAWHRKRCTALGQRSAELRGLLRTQSWVWGPPHPLHPARRRIRAGHCPRRGVASGRA